VEIGGVDDASVFSSESRIQLREQVVVPISLFRLPLFFDEISEPFHFSLQFRNVLFIIV